MRGNMGPLSLIRPLKRVQAGDLPFRLLSGPTRRTLVAPPRPNSGPLLSRRADRELPSVASHRRWLRTVPAFAVVLVAATLGIFNYQKSSSSVVSGNLYALRRSEQARELLGDEIYFAHRIPWISGELNQLHGRIDISFRVKGNRAEGKMRFKSTRQGRMGFFKTEIWSLEMDDGRIVQLLDGSGNDPSPDQSKQGLDTTAQAA